MTGPGILIATVALVAGITWVAMFRPWIDEVALVALCVLCAVLSVL